MQYSSMKVQQILLVHRRYHKHVIETSPDRLSRPGIAHFRESIHMSQYDMNLG